MKHARKLNLYTVCSACLKLIRAVSCEQIAEIKEAIRDKARDSEITRSQDWCELRHCIQRWRSYGDAAKTIHHASKRWPSLFKDFKILTLPSSNRMFKPILKFNITADTIVQGIAAADSIEREVPSAASKLLQQAEPLKLMDIDQAIQDIVGKSTFRPIVHAEILIYDYLLKKGIIDHPANFWNQWQYIASSKPTCRLCHYFFQSQEYHQIQVRRSHFNLYINWRLPTTGDDNPGLQEAYSKLLSKIAGQIRLDARKTLELKTAKQKKHDSNTYSTPYGARQRARSASNSAMAQSSTDSLSEAMSEATVQSGGEDN